MIQFLLIIIASVIGVVSSDSIIGNGKVILGVNSYGNLYAPYVGGILGLPRIDPIRNPSGGILLRNGDGAAGKYSAIESGRLLEGWGAGVKQGGTFTSTCGSNKDFGLGSGMTLFSESGVNGGSTALSVVTCGPDGRRGMYVSHDFTPSASPDLMQAKITLSNSSPNDYNEVHYRRSVDWDIDPSLRDSRVTHIGVRTTSSLVISNDNGSCEPNPGTTCPPLNASTSMVDFTDNKDCSGCNGNFVGSTFQFNLGPIKSRQSVSFTLFYGASKGEAAAMTAIDVVKAELVSLGQAGNSSLAGLPYTFILAFSGVRGIPILTSATPSSKPSSQPIKKPSAKPSSKPSAKPSPMPSSKPSVAPIVARSVSPSVSPTVSPSDVPVTAKPSANPSQKPVTAIPSMSPSISPSSVISATPSTSPSAAPVTALPSTSPSAAPVTDAPSHSPSAMPVTTSPSTSPSAAPVTAVPSESPSSVPVTAVPSRSPSLMPVTAAPSTSPSAAPITAVPSMLPSAAPITSAPSGKPSLRLSGTPVFKWILVNADKDTDIGTINMNQVFSFRLIKTKDLSVRLDAPWNTKQVVFTWRLDSGSRLIKSIENTFPFYMSQNNKNNAFPVTYLKSVGMKTINATVTSSSGDIIGTATIQFQMIN